MFKNILIPLDGSSYAEAALPFSIRLAEKLGSRITLLHVIEKSPPKTVHGEHHLSEYGEAEKYLDNLKKKYFPSGIKVDFHIHHGDDMSVDKAIALHHNEISSDLFLMTTHGWGGLKEIFFGNIAQQILNTCSVPILFIPPSVKDPDVKWPKKILLPLDGSAAHEKGGEAALYLAGNSGSDLFLAYVIPTLNTLNAEQTAVGVLLPGVTREILEMEETGAAEYIEKKRNEFEAKGLSRIKTGIYRGDPAAIIGELTGKEDIDLIALGTHGRVGLSAFWSGSIGARVTGRARTAILFVPIA
jgi:nucleotide-binding universal stress UspA family protein